MDLRQLMIGKDRQTIFTPRAPVGFKSSSQNACFSDRSLVSTFNSQQHSGHQTSDDPENIWSLTNRIHHDGAGKSRNPEYSVNTAM